MEIARFAGKIAERKKYRIFICLGYFGVTTNV